ncbi:MICOS complex subunit MIC60-like isoform X1 [Populus alba x Populus x berolinensis]|uniref:MICOS complex subunit MIC60-like isoform X1 n=1 Tax=Populus alba x Populus x berolinensis TaxID=444605 RepID=A0AAD6QIA5_9ROSI|nr:MICOS complex subunit MIC60-like isoform X1 [Populus alba x Populus x berolinensis]
MLRRSLLELSSRRQSLSRIPRQITSQACFFANKLIYFPNFIDIIQIQFIKLMTWHHKSRMLIFLLSISHLLRVPPFLSSRKEFSTTFQKNASPNGDQNDKSERTGSLLAKGLGAALVVGTCYYAGWLDPFIEFIGKKKQGYVNSGGDGIDHEDVSAMSEEANKLSHFIEEAAQKVQTQTDLPNVETKKDKVETRIDVPHVETEQKVETPSDLPHVETEQKADTISKTESDNQFQVDHGTISVEERHEPKSSQCIGSEGSLGVESPELKTTEESNEGTQVTEVQPQDATVPVEREIKAVQTQNVTSEDRSEQDAFGEGGGTSSLLDSYHLDDEAEKNTATEGLGEQAIGSAIEELNEGYLTKDGKLVMDFLEAIHAAEKRQADLDALAFAEEKKALKEKYEKELRDLRARELMHVEKAAILDKEIKRERAKAAAAIKTLQERMEEKLRLELEKKENEAEMKLQKLSEFAKAELLAASAREKAAQIEKMTEANLNINALCMAFYARSEEARQIHSVHKLALGALALEDALYRGLPIQQELDALNTYLEAIDKDSLLLLVLSNLPEETKHHGPDTLLELNQKASHMLGPFFNVMKGNLRHYILIPPGGGGILAHALAHVASWLRFKEVEPSGDGIESLISRVEGFLAEGKLAEAADALQKGVQGSQAEEIAGDWVRRARNRAITEQALTVLQSYATCIGLTQ